MAKQGMCITAEGTDEPAVFEDLQAQAAAAERRMQQQAQSGERIRELEAALAEVQTQR